MFFFLLFFGWRCCNKSLVFQAVITPDYATQLHLCDHSCCNIQWKMPLFLLILTPCPKAEQTPVTKHLTVLWLSVWTKPYKRLCETSACQVWGNDYTHTSAIMSLCNQNSGSRQTRITRTHHGLEDRKVMQWWWILPPWRNGNLHSLPDVVKTADGAWKNT